ncbi:MAG: hypothetical protein EPO45_17030 [Sphingobium sp.]|nr:MAG: hypothetical protein EPO45_17030 [Sphingobium sp.]
MEEGGGERSLSYTRPNPAPFVSSEVEKPARCFSTSLETNGGGEKPSSHRAYAAVGRGGRTFAVLHQPRLL